MLATGPHSTRTQPCPFQVQSLTLRRHCRVSSRYSPSLYVDIAVSLPDIVPHSTQTLPCPFQVQSLPLRRHCRVPSRYSPFLYADIAVSLPGIVLTLRGHCCVPSRYSPSLYADIAVSLPGIILSPYSKRTLPFLPGIHDDSWVPEF